MALLAVLAVATLENLAIDAFFPHLARLTTDFSATYLRRDLTRLAHTSAPTIFLGDSVLWGYRLPANQTAVALLAAGGCRCENLAFKSGSPPNYYALVQAMTAAGVKPQTVVIEVNQKVFNPADAAYATLHPALAAIAEPLLPAADRARLSLSSRSGRGGIESTLESLSLLYAMRSDIRETLYGDVDVVPAQPPTAELYEGTYDLTPLTPDNVAVHYFDETLALLARKGIPVVAFLTPTNHSLLHDYIDSAAYRANERYLQRLLHRGRARVVDLDAAFPASRFIDESHLTAQGQRELAAILARAADLPHR